MSDRYNDDFAALLTPPPSQGVQFTQAKVLTWNLPFLQNTLEWRGITLTDIPLVEGVNALAIRPGDIVGMLGWAPENAKGVGSWWILGKLSNPGEFVADLTFYLGQVRFRTPDDEYDQVFFGSDTDGDPLTILYYGDASSSRALNIANRQTVSLGYARGISAITIDDNGSNAFIRIRDASDNEIVGSDALTEVGLSRPWLNYLLSPASTAQQDGTGNFSFWPSTDSTSYTTLWEGINSIWHPRVAWGVNVAGVGGTSDVRIRVDNGTGFTTVEEFSASSSGIFDIPGWGTDINPSGDATFIVQGRNSAGRVYTNVNKFYGRQS